MNEIIETQLDNGVRIFYVQAPSEDISVIASINAGPLYEYPANYGISHLVEHMLFKGTARRESRDAIYNELGLLGGEDFCYTDKRNVVLGMRVIKDDFDSALDLMSDVLYSARMDAGEVEKEKKIVSNEIRVRNDKPNVAIYDKFEEHLFHGCPLMHSPIGYAEVVDGLNPQHVAQFYRETFTPRNTALFVVGSISYEELEAKIKKYFGNVQSSDSEKRIPNIIIPNNEKRSIIVPKNLDNVYVMLGRIVPSSTHEDSYALKILGSALSRSVSERILNQEPISYERWVYYDGNVFAGSIVAYATAEAQHYSRVLELILEEFSKYSRGIIPDEYIIDEKRKMMKGFILNNSSTMDKAQRLMGFWLSGDVNKINTHLNKINQVSVEQVKEAGRRHIKIDDLLLLSLGMSQ